MAEQSRSRVCLPAAPTSCVAASVTPPHRPSPAQSHIPQVLSLLICQHSYKTRSGVVSVSEDLGLERVKKARLSVASYVTCERDCYGTVLFFGFVFTVMQCNGENIAYFELKLSFFMYFYVCIVFFLYLCLSVCKCMYVCMYWPENYTELVKGSRPRSKCRLGFHGPSVGWTSSLGARVS
ncbi:hypothetical protein E2C01_090482 [Portunus trituberculatus]|uniref:Uncharacterized protein n=1 Tax=Portunus trituberculatus TaxID=210409 RepID=A0A5B7JKC5_PORTR|nr:hypothetical protein [Portunus trituberculatus]